MTATLRFSVCPHFAPEFTRALERLGLERPAANVDPLACTCEAGACRAPVARVLVPGEAPAALPSCFQLVAGATLARALEADGARLASPGTAAHWLEALERGEAPGALAGPPGEPAPRELVLLDTGVEPAAGARAARLAQALGLPLRTLRVGLDGLEAQLGGIIDRRLLRREQQRARVQLAASQLRLAEATMALELLRELFGASSEADAAARIVALLTKLFCPREVAYMGFSQGVPTVTLPEPLGDETRALLEGFEGDPAPIDDESFVFALVAGGETVAAVRVSALVSPQHRDEAMTLARTIAEHCAEAVLSARRAARQREVELELREHYKLESVGRLAAGVAHELNTPTQFVGDNVAFVLNGLGGLTEVLRRGAALVEHLGAGADCVAEAAALKAAAADLDVDYFLEAAPQALQQSAEGMARIGAIVASMQAFARPGETHPEFADVNVALRTTLEVARNEYKYVANVQLELADVPEVYGYAAELNQVFLVLIANAAKAIEPVARETGALGTIEVRTWVAMEHVFVSIKDTGRGMPIEPPEHLFEQFFTTKSPAPQAAGLPMVWQVVERHGGNVTFETTPGVGTTFVLEFPAGQDWSAR